MNPSPVPPSRSALFTPDLIEEIVQFRSSDPYKILGPHLLENERRLVINAFLPNGNEAWVHLLQKDDPLFPMEKIHAGGFFQVILEGMDSLSHYTLQTRDAAGILIEWEDPYAAVVEMTDFDLYLLGKGEHFHSYEKLGAHLTTLGNLSGVRFAVWAPNAQAIGVVGDFNGWRVGNHPLARMRGTDVWSLFIPGLKEGDLYKYAVRAGPEGQIKYKSDPFAFSTETRPKTASIVVRLDHHKWQDEKWMKERPERNGPRSPISIYEVHIGSWRRPDSPSKEFYNYRELAPQLVDYVKSMGFTHLQFLPVMEHPLDKSWGYQIINYYAPTARFGNPEDLMSLIDLCHQNGIGVLLDWVPAHFPRDDHGLNEFDGTQLYAYKNWKRGEHKEWGTLVFDYGRNEVRNFLISNALFWLDKYHIDGLRVDAVASMLYLDYSRRPGEWEPNIYGGRENLEAITFLQKFNETVHARFPGVVTIAEESTAWSGVCRPTYLGGLGFSMKWNMGWMHDTLECFSKDPVHRKYHQGKLTFTLAYAFSENFILPISHDEVVYGKKSLINKMPGDGWQKFANTRLLLGFMFSYPGKKLLFMGSEFGQWNEWWAEESLHWNLLEEKPHQALQLFSRDLNTLYKQERPLWNWDFEPQSFEWVDYSDTQTSVFSFVRWARDYEELLLVTCNLTAIPRFNYRVGVPQAGYYEEILNSDAKEYGGSGIGNQGGVEAEKIPTHHRPYSLNLHLPPLAMNIFRRNAQNVHVR